MRIVHDLRYGILTLKRGRDVIAECVLSPITSGVAQWAISGCYYDVTRHDLRDIDASELRRLVSCIEQSIDLQLRYRMHNEHVEWVAQELGRLRRAVCQHGALTAAILDHNTLYTVHDVR